MSTNTTLQDLKNEYLRVFGRDCNDETATALLEDFEKGVEHYENADADMKNSEHILWGETLEKFMILRKFEIDRDKARTEYNQKLAAMTGEERWLHIEGFDDDKGKWFHNFLIKTEDGNEIIKDILGETDRTNVETIKNMLEKAVAAAKFDFVDISLIDEYISKFNKGIESWFVGIFGYGGRPWRTAHIIFKSYCTYCEDKSKGLLRVQL